MKGDSGRIEEFLDDDDDGAETIVPTTRSFMGGTEPYVPDRVCTTIYA